MTMAGQGPPPKDPATRRRRNKDPNPVRRIDADEELRGFDLPSGCLPDDECWHPQTVAWWNVWRAAPQAQEMLNTDWQVLLETALLHHVLWSRGKWEYASEVRLRVAAFGATLADRQRLRMQVTVPDRGLQPTGTDSSTASVTAIRSRRARIGAG
jgi:hypothetical protein